MVTTETRADVRLISKEALRTYMEFRGETIRSLASKVGASHGTIGHLRTGKQKYIRAEWARTIETILNAPPGSLFEIELSTVSRERPGTKRAA
ncbi:helix-turn-helix transcriptional regulator [Brachybacterium halotolerans subsp. kimchii]|uniref:helix-turn-helix domain-containing protein n=1 Tax=Brachybacterium halotolerans TaxID=2795215 RepID=UPI001E429D10|nr:helix-turn-helix transcriptional regulator [Brachybacterium halotolerans]UEJ83950.1 helix-turn-helix transcriptional regulator [Brachybacterium halotolerans subsp. kimchii]